jgi:hypothetical protein
MGTWEYYVLSLLGMIECGAGIFFLIKGIRHIIRSLE